MSLNFYRMPFKTQPVSAYSITLWLVVRDIELSEAKAFPIKVSNLINKEGQIFDKKFGAVASTQAPTKNYEL